MPTLHFTRTGGRHFKRAASVVRSAIHVVSVPQTSRDYNVTGADFNGASASNGPSEIGASHNGTKAVCCWISTCCLVLLVLMVLFVASPFGHPTTDTDYAINSISIKGINLTSPESLTLSPEFDISISYGNRDENMGLYYYEKGSFISISYSNMILCSSGETMPTFHQPKNNVTLLGMMLKCKGVKITTTIHDSLLRDQRQGKIRFAIDMKIPIRADTGAVEVTPRLILMVFCAIKVNGLAMDSEIISQKQCVVVNKIWTSNYKNKGWEDSENKLAKASS